MKKELLLIALLIGLPTFFIMNFGDTNAIGKLVEEMAVLRMQRIETYIGFPATLSITHQAIVDRIRQGMLANSDADFYSPSGLQNGDRYFYNELILFKELLTLMCLQPTGFGVNGTYVSPDGMHVTLLDNRWQGTEFNNAPCNPELQQMAKNAIVQLITLDIQLVQSAIQSSSCPKLATSSMERARNDIAIGAFEPALVNLENAWSKAVNCA